MVRRFLSEPIPEEVLQRVLASGLKAPSAGFTQGVELMVLEEPSVREVFWQRVDPIGRKKPTDVEPPVILLPLVNKQAYLDRYSEPDKSRFGLGVDDAWPVPYWDVDAGMVAMLVLLAAVEEGLGAWFFGVFQGGPELMTDLGLPDSHRPIGAIALGYPHPEDRPSGSAVSRPRRETEEMIHRNRWKH